MGEEAVILSEDDGRREYGRGLRKIVPRSSQAHFELPAGRDPVQVLEGQELDELPDLVGLRRKRMVSNPFAFYRGSAALMAADLAEAPTSGIEVVASGDAHISNFGFFATPERTLVFDLNDFDEAAVAPWEWDVKRLVTSVIIAAWQAGHADEEAQQSALAAALAYRQATIDFSQLSAIEQFYVRADIEEARKGMHKDMRRVLDRAVGKAAERTGEAYFEKITAPGPDGSRRVVEKPPVLERLTSDERARLLLRFEEYRRTVRVDVSILLTQYKPTDIVRRVVGVGSVGKRAYLLIIEDAKGQPLLLQVKEVGASVLCSHGRRPRRILDSASASGDISEGRRVVENQLILQGASDPFLGWVSGGGRDYYVRQFRDRKSAIDPTKLGPRELARYARACGVLLARGHAQSGRATAVAGYLGSADVFDRSVVAWSAEYARQALADYEVLRRRWAPQA